MTRLVRPSRLAAAALAVAALGLGACTNQDASGEDAAEALVEADAPEEAAECVGRRFDDDLTQEQRNDVAKADDLADDLSSELEQQVRAIMAECFQGDGADEGDTTDTTDTTGSDDTGETPETTGG